MTDQIAISVEDIVVGYGGVPVVKEVSLHVTEGSVVTILGPNGAGKSTLIKGMGGVLRPTGGRVELRGADITGYDASRIAGLGMAYVPQTRDVCPPMTVKENLEIGGYLLARDEVRDRIDARADEFPQLKNLMGRVAGTLSGGERKLVAIARALMADSTVLLLDEPTAALSPSMAGSVLEGVVRKIADRGTAIVMVEQRAQLAMGVSDWVCVLVDGRVAAWDTATSIASRGDFLELLAGVPPEMSSANNPSESQEC